MSQWSTGGSGKTVSSPFCTELEGVGVVRIPWENTAGNMLGKVTVIDKKDEENHQDSALSRKVLCPELGSHNV